MTLPTRITADAPEARSADVVADNLTKLKALFPDAFTEGKIDFEVLKQLLGGAVDERDEKYGLNWHGKRQARQLALTPSLGTLRPCPEESVDWDTTQNLMIEGDNLEVLKLLQKSYAGKVKLIYIDPPYNTGNDFVYPDDFQDSIGNYQRLTGQVGEAGERLTANTESSGRFHTDWLNMMYPRMKLAWSLLSDDGSMFISIDEKEAHHLRELADELFGAESFVANVTAVTNMKGRNDKRHVASCHEQVIIYAKPRFVSFGLPLTEEQRQAFRYTDEKGRRYALRDLRKRGGPDRREDRPKMYFPIYWSPSDQRVSLERMKSNDVEILPLRGDGSEGCWRWGIEKVRTCLSWMHPKQSDRTSRLDVEHRVYLDPGIRLGDCPVDDQDDEGGDEDGDSVERTSKPKSIWLNSNFSSDSGKRAMKEFIPGEAFDFPKSVDLLRQCLQIGMGRDGVALDFFAGSGTLGQAVLDHNLADGGNRHFVLIQLPEPLCLDEKDQRCAAKFCAEIGVKATIAELTKERLRRVGRKNKERIPLFAGDLGFRVLKLDSSNIATWEPQRSDLTRSIQQHIDHLKPGRTQLDLLFEILLKYGIDLATPITTATIAGMTIHRIGGGVLIVCLANDLSITATCADELGRGLLTDLAAQGVALSDVRLVFKDQGFADDVAKTNLVAILTQGGIDDAHIRTL